LRDAQHARRNGIKFTLENENWLLRFSGTETVLHMFAEADSPEKVQELLEAVCGDLNWK
jgi:phosphomannomutase